MGSAARGSTSKVGASSAVPVDPTPGLLNTGIWRPGRTAPIATTARALRRQEGPRLADADARTHAEAVGQEVVFAPLVEVADLCFEGIRDDVFWITAPSEDQHAKIRARADSQIAMTSPDYLLGVNLMTTKPTTAT